MGKNRGRHFGGLHENDLFGVHVGVLLFVETTSSNINQEATQCTSFQALREH